MNVQGDFLGSPHSTNTSALMSKHGGKYGCSLHSCHVEDWTGLHSWYAVQASGFGKNLQKVRKQSDTECKYKQIATLPFQN